MTTAAALSASDAAEALASFKEQVGSLVARLDRREDDHEMETAALMSSLERMRTALSPLRLPAQQ
jgi:hypothetical protein